MASRPLTARDLTVRDFIALLERTHPGYLDLVVGHEQDGGFVPFQGRFALLPSALDPRQYVVVVE